MILGPAQVLPIPSTTTGGDVLEVPGILHGWTFHNPDLTARTDLTLTDGPNGALVVVISLTPGQSTRDWLSGLGIDIVTGISLHVQSGTIEGALWFRPTGDDPLTHAFDVHGALDQLAELLLRR